MTRSATSSPDGSLVAITPAALAPPETDVPEDELRRALDLAEALTTDDLGDLNDHYKEAVEEVITAKIEDRQLSPMAAPAPREPVLVDLMAALNESVAAARQSRGESGEHATVHEMLPPKRTAKKTTPELVRSRGPGGLARRMVLIRCRGVCRLRGVVSQRALPMLRSASEPLSMRVVSSMRVKRPSGARSAKT
ncbi:hypothetical protein [Streptomyces sp. NBC_00829]|uniref:hypothetical protein n=1 Tax=Streptomyces sp. NBC_00829 TaxID=2903679 RepID=UPI00386F92C6|nr:hypothetical protein OG293_31560 [Streptomyces sp. NBC_00829]